MTSMRSSQNHSGIPNPDSFKAAKKCLEAYPEDTIKYLAEKCDPIRLLQFACAARGQDYHKVMSEDVVSEDDMTSQSSRRGTFSSNSRSGLATSPSTVLSSSGSGPGSHFTRTLWVMPENKTDLPKTLMAIFLPRSDDLIQLDTVRNHLLLDYEHLSGGDVGSARYNGGLLESYGTVSFSCARSLKDLNENNLQQRTFYVVEELPEGKVVLRDSDAQQTPIHRAALPFGSGTQPNSYGNTNLSKTNPLFGGHGYSFQQPRYSHSETENSTTAKPTSTYKAGQGLKQRQQPTASETSKIPMRKNSGRSVRSAASFGQPRAPPGRGPIVNATVPPPLQSGLTDELRVTLVPGPNRLGTVKLDLLAPGPSVYEKLKAVVKKKSPRDLDRESDSVQFTPDEQHREPSCWVSLLEDELEDDWKEAVKFFEKLENGPKVFAFIERDDG